MHAVFALLCFVVVIHWLIFPYPSGLLHWHCGNLTIAPVPAKQPWWIWINTSCEFIMNDCITTTKQSTRKTVCIFLEIYCIRCSGFACHPHPPPPNQTEHDQPPDSKVFTCRPWIPSQYVRLPHLLYLGKTGDMASDIVFINLCQNVTEMIRGPTYKHGLALIPAWINNHINYKMWDRIISIHS